MPPKFKDITFNFLPVRVALSNDQNELKRRSMNLYKAWYRQIPIIIYDYKLALAPEEARSKLREIYVRNSKIKDPREINALIMRGEMELNETVNKQKEACHLWKYFRTEDRQPQSFLTRFLEGR